MALQDPSTYSAGDLANPALDDATLRHIAQYRPDLRGYVLQHPACSPALAQMIHASGAPQAPQTPSSPAVPSVPHAPAGFNLNQASGVAAAPAFPNPSQQFAQAQQYGQAQQFAQPVAQAPQHPQAVAWAQWFQQTTGRQPGPADFQGAVAAGYLPHEVLMGRPAGAPLTPGIPARLGVLGKLLFLIPIGAVIAIIGTFLPIVSIDIFGERFAPTYWEGGADGPIILVCNLIAIVVAVLAFLMPAKWSYIVAGVVALVSQILPLVSAIAGMAHGAEYELPLGPAVFVVLLGAIVVVAGAITTLISSRKL